MKMVFIISLLFLNGCAMNSSGLTSDYSTPHRAYSYDPVYDQSNNNDHFDDERNMNSAYFNHNGAIGYGGVDVYSYRGV